MLAQYQTSSSAAGPNLTASHSLARQAVLTLAWQVAAQRRWVQRLRQTSSSCCIAVWQNLTLPPQPCAKLCTLARQMAESRVMGAQLLASEQQQRLLAQEQFSVVQQQQQQIAGVPRQLQLF